MPAALTAPASSAARINQGFPDRSIGLCPGGGLGDCPAVFLGMQEGAEPGTSFALYNLTRPVGIHPEGSTVSRETLEQHGFTAPAAPANWKGRA